MPRRSKTLTGPNRESSTTEMDSNTKVLEWLRRRELRDGTLPPALKTYERLLVLWSNWGFLGPQVRMTRDSANARLEKGVPLLTFQELDFDWARFVDLYRDVASLLAACSPAVQENGQRDLALECSLPLLKEAAGSWFSGNTPTALPDEADTAILESAVQAAIKPLLARYRDALLPLVDMQGWRRTYCPVCGGQPYFSFLDREHGARWLVCSRCDAEWLFQRLQCPFCGNQDPNSLSYFTNDQALYRLYVCDDCGRYLKAIDLRKATDEAPLPIEYLLTTEMDRQAHEQGYVRAAATN